MREIRDAILRMKDSDFVPMILVGNKNDLESERQVSEREGYDLAQKWGVQHNSK